MLEVILAIGLTLLLITTVLVFYRQTSNIRASVIGDARVVSSQRLVMQRLTDELRGAMIYPFMSMGLQGRNDPITGDRMQFFTASLPGASAWAVRTATEDAVPLEADQQIVSYRLRIPRDEQGQPLRDDNGNIIVEGLERTCQKVLSSTAQEGQEITVTLLTPHIKFMMLRYWDGSSWVGSWSSADLPLAVEITLGEKPLTADEAPEEYSHEFARRVVYLPGGTKAMNGTIIRGLDSAGGRP
ncbi:MAG: hypothetical protein EHM48_00930 [Planctomycetaceae bacterium]|nr:MAG: hypothetical protein EHM48_00930 [Planctomycetaceae bacterium]